jgi:hypothetical protein
MPGMDGTGPMGMGPMTGGGRGLCNPLWTGYWGAAPFWPGYRGYFPSAGFRGRYPWRFRTGLPYSGTYFGRPQWGYGVRPWRFGGYFY